MVLGFPPKKIKIKNQRNPHTSSRFIPSLFIISVGSFVWKKREPCTTTTTTTMVGTIIGSERPWHVTVESIHRKWTIVCIARRHTERERERERMDCQAQLPMLQNPCCRSICPPASSVLYWRREKKEGDRQTPDKWQILLLLLPTSNFHNMPRKKGAKTAVSTKTFFTNLFCSFSSSQHIIIIIIFFFFFQK